MSKPQTDDFGVEIEVGDIILSSPQNSKADIGRVEKISATGRITIKHKIDRLIYAYERGAPDKPCEATRPMLNENGQVMYEDHFDPYGLVRRAKFEKYTAYQKDYTVVGRREEWVKTQCAEISRIVLRKGSDDSGALSHPVWKLVIQNYDAELGEIE